HTHLTLSWPVHPPGPASERTPHVVPTTFAPPKIHRKEPYEPRSRARPPDARVLFLRRNRTRARTPGANATPRDRGLPRPTPRHLRPPHPRRPAAQPGSGARVPPGHVRRR